MNWQLYTNRMNAWQALNPAATPEQREAASFAIERDVANQLQRLDRRIEKRVSATPARAPIGGSKTAEV